MTIRAEAVSQIQTKKFSYILLFIVLALIILSFFVASVTALSIESMSSGTYKQSSALDLKIGCFENSTSTYCSNTTFCNLTIIAPDSSLFINNKGMTWNPAYFNYTLSASQTATAGEYSTTVLCSGTTTGYSTFTYEILSLGSITSQSINPMLAIGVLIWLIFFVFIYSGNEYLGLLSSSTILIFGIYLLNEGILGINNLLTQSIGAIHIAVGLIFLLAASWEVIK